MLSRYLQKLTDLIRLVQIKPHNTETSEGRSKERYRRAALTTLASLVSKGVVVFTTFISVPLTIGYLGTERYGMWMTMSSLIAILGFLDLGMGNSLKNHIADANGRDDKDAAVRAISSAYVVLTIIAIALGLIFLILYPHIPWMRIFNVSSPLAIAESGPAVAVFIVCFLLNIPLSLIIQIQSGYQEGFVSNIWQSAGSILGLLGVLIVIYLKAGLPWLVCTMAGAPLIINILNLLTFFKNKPNLIPSIKKIDVQTTKKIFNTGTLFLFGQIVSIAVQSVDNIIIAQVIGAIGVAVYSVTVRLFSILSMVQNAAVTPFWPAYGESIARGDIRWVRETLRRTVILSILITLPASLLLVYWGDSLIHLWTGKELHPPLNLLIGVALWTVISAVASAVAMLLTGATMMKEQLYIGMVLLLVAVPTKIYSGQVWGLPGVILSGVVTYSFIVLIPYLIIGKRTLKKLHKYSELRVE